MDANFLYSNSLVEQTLEGHSDTPTRADRPLVAGTDGKMYLWNPTNGYISRFPDDFTGCLGCGSPDHCFRSCPRSNENFLKDIFW